MARSTIQEKLSGKSPAKLTQVLALVAAIAEYGRKNGAPLTPQEIDENSWRAKYVAAMGKHGRMQHTGASEAESAETRRTWDPEPLRQAGMADLIDLISQSEGAPPATWLPHVAGEMVQAQMSCKGLMEWAAHGSAQDVVECAAALDQLFPLPGEGPPDPWSNWSEGHGATVTLLLRYAARVHGATSAPVIVVGLRRAEAGNMVRPFLVNIACWHLAHNLEQAVKRLRSAELDTDAINMLKYVGAERLDTRVMEVVHYFNEQGSTKDRDAVLTGMTEESIKRFLIAIRESDSEEIRGTLVNAIPWSKRSDYVEALKGDGFLDLATQVAVPRYSDEPPF
ncbi:hypothetical protein [Streptomyces sp. NPDC059479]|uniref:hypothetical protein n=1 Tax=Streptomyces sp. NPDC059479 TaxID=3346848 RepID=UPI0036BAF3AC